MIQCKRNNDANRSYIVFSNASDDTLLKVADRRRSRAISRFARKCLFYLSRLVR